MLLNISRYTAFCTLFFIFLFCFTTNLNAAVYKCTVEGKLTFQQFPCSEGEQDTLINSFNEYSLHNSWFERPGYLVNSARCTDIGCTCSDQVYDYQEHESMRLLNAMVSLQSIWKSHKSDLTHYNGIKNREEYPSLRKNLERKACRISVEQTTIKRYFFAVNSSVSNDYNNAVSHFEKIDGECVKPDESGFTMSEEAKEYVRCSDAIRKDRKKALQVKRSASMYYKELERETAKLKQTKP